MRSVCPFLVAAVVSFGVVADDDYSDTVFTAVAFMYWCTHHEVPRSVEDFAKVTDMDHSDPRITLDPNEWFKSVQFLVEGDTLKIKRVAEPKESGSGDPIGTTTSTSNCESFDPPLR